SCYAKWRMSVGLPDYSNSDRIIVGSQWSRSDLIDNYSQSPDRVFALPYPIDLQRFRPTSAARSKNGRLRILWLGRFIPRKRLDLFLAGLAEAIRAGCDVEALVIGSSAFVPNYERLIDEFPYSSRIRHRTSIARSEVPKVLADVDVLAQPSDDENFGSSVAEALACGIPVVVGKTNGTRDYICDRSIALPDDSPSSMAQAIASMIELKSSGELRDHAPSRDAAEHHFEPSSVLEQLIAILNDASTEFSAK
ncbi:MAG: glycosyltransferase family 4 protein, partial [Planctomycetota bacterium]